MRSLAILWRINKLCGLAGVSGNLYKQDLDAFSDLLYMTALRGQDSTGIAVVDGGFNTRVYKGPISAADFIETRNFDKFVTTTSRVIMGHCRKATLGKINFENSHPFDFKELVGCHNGTIPWISKSQLPGHEKFDTDSETIFYSFGKLGYEDTLSKMTGAWALVWYDKKYRRINFLRNAERSLYYTFNDKKDRLYWGSEVGMLHAALSRNGVKYDKIFSFPVDTMYSWEVPKGSESFGEPDRVHVEGKKEEKTFFPERATASSTTSNRGIGYGRPPWDWNPAGTQGYYCSQRQRYIMHVEALKEFNTLEEIENKKKEIKDIDVNFPHPNNCQCRKCKPDITVKPVSETSEIADKIQQTQKELTNVVSLRQSITARPFLGTTNRHLTYVDEKGKKLNKRQFEAKTEKGCDWCHSEIRWQDPCIFYGGQVYCLEHQDDADETCRELLKHGGRFVQ